MIERVIEIGSLPDAGRLPGHGPETVDLPSGVDGSAHDLLGRFVEALPVIAWATNGDGVPIAVNARWMEYTGEPLALGGPPDRSAIHRDDIATLDSAWAEALSKGTPLEIAARVRRRDGEWRWHLIRGVPIATGGNTTWLGTSTDIDHERREQERNALAAAGTHRLLALMQALARARTRAEVARVAIRHGRTAIGSPRGYVYVRSADGTAAEAVALSGFPRATHAQLRRLSIADDRPVCRAMRTGEECWIDDLLDPDTRAAHIGRTPAAAAPTATGSRGTVAMPLVHEGRIVGAIGFSFLDPHRWTDDEEAVVRAIAGLVAQALERVMLSEAREELVADLETQHARLSTILRQLPGAVFLVEASSRRILMASRLARQVLGLEDVTGATLDDVRLYSIREDGSPYGPGELPIERAIQQGEIVENEELQVTLRDGSVRTLIASAAPVRDRAGRIEAGVVAFTDITDRRQALADQRYLAEVSGVLASSLDYHQTLRTIARLAVPRIADWCSVELLEDGVLRQIVVEHPDPAKAELARDLRRRYPIDMNGDTGAPAVVRSGEPQLISDIPQALLEAAASTEELRLIIDDLALRSVLCVPLNGRDGVLGAITFVGAESGRRFVAEDIPFARNLASRAAAAIDNARLFRDADRFRRMVDAHVDVVLLFDPGTLRITYANQGAATALGRTAGDLAGTSVADLFADADAARMRTLIRPVTRGLTSARTLTLRLAGVNGDVPMEVLVQGVRLPGEPLAALAIARDVSDRLETQRRLRRLAEAEHARAAELNAVIRAMGDGLLVCAPDGVVRLANPAAGELLGGVTPATYGDLLRALEHPDDAPALGTRSGPVELRLAGTDERWLELATYPVGVQSDPAHEETIVVARDVTGTRLSQALRETFVGVLSHELRTPITTIFGGAKLLARDGPLSPAEREAIFTDIHFEAERLHRLVEDVIALTRFGEDGLEIGQEPVLLQRILPGIITAETARWPGAAFTLEAVTGLPTVIADPTYVEQVVRNLLSNAAKYGGDGVHVRTLVDSDAAEVTVRVVDDGPGFPDADKDRLFELYFRSPDSSTRVSGAGIGLFVCARLIRAMGGRIWARRAETGGAEFGFALRRMDEDGVS